MLVPGPSEKAYRFSKPLICVMAKMGENAPQGYTNYCYTNYEFAKTLEALKNIRSLCYDKEEPMQKHLDAAKCKEPGDD